MYGNICLLLPPYICENLILTGKEKNFNHLDKCGHIFTQNDYLSKLFTYLTWAKSGESDEVYIGYVATLLKKLKIFIFIFTPLNLFFFKCLCTIILYSSIPFQGYQLCKGFICYNQIKQVSKKCAARF